MKKLLPKHNIHIGLEVCQTADWNDALRGCSSIIHLAARVHVMSDIAIDRLTKFRHLNTEGTINLLRQATAVGV